MRLLNKQGQPVNVGDVAHDFRGEAAIVTGWQEPAHEGSTGRVYVRTMEDNAFEAGYYPGVYSMQWSQ
jgi:hypothetical protein